MTTKVTPPPLPTAMQAIEDKLAVNKNTNLIESANKSLLDEIAATGPRFSNLPEPPWPINEIAYWIYSYEMTSPNRDIAILSAWLLVAAFAGRKDSFLGNPPSFNVTMLAINGVGKDTVKRVLEKVCRQLTFAHSEAGTIGNQAALGFSGVDPAHGTEKMRQNELRLVSGLRITSEAGLNKQSTSGDTPKVRAALLQNTAQPAYSRRSYYSAASDKENLRPYGPSVSVLDESTPETYLSSMGGTVGTGEAARNLMVRIDASKVGQTSYRNQGQPVLTNIILIFDRLLEEALRHEEVNHADGMSSVPVPPEHQQRFRMSEEVDARIAELEQQDTEHRRANKENVADLGWAQVVRGPQIIFRLSLIAARTRALISNQAAVVEIGDLNAAEEFVAECRRTERANAADYEDAHTRAAKLLFEWSEKQLAKNEPGAQWKRHAAPGDHAERKVRYSVAYTNCGNTAHAKAIRVLAEEQNKSPKSVYAEILSIGESNSYWEVVGDLVFQIGGVTD